MIWFAWTCSILSTTQLVHLMSDITQTDIKLENPKLHMGEELHSKILKASEDLKENGWTVIPALFDLEETAQFLDSFWEFFDRIGLPKDLDFKNTYSNQLPPHSHGLLHSHGINHGLFFSYCLSHSLVQLLL